MYLFILYPASMHAVCMCVRRQTHLQLLTSSWLVLLHHMWKLISSVKQKKYIFRKINFILTCPWNKHIVKTGQLTMTTPWSQMFDSPPASASACLFQRLSLHTTSSLLPAQLYEDGNETVTSSTHAGMPSVYMSI